MNNLTIDSSWVIALLVLVITCVLSWIMTNYLTKLSNRSFGTMHQEPSLLLAAWPLAVVIILILCTIINLDALPVDKPVFTIAVSVIIISFQMALTISAILFLAKKPQDRYACKVLQGLPARCVELGIAGTFLGFLFLFIGLMQKSNGMTTGSIEAQNIILALSTSLTGISLSFCLQFIIDHYRDCDTTELSKATKYLGEELVSTKGLVKRLKTHIKIVSEGFWKFEKNMLKMKLDSQISDMNEQIKKINALGMDHTAVDFNDAMEIGAETVSRLTEELISICKIANQLTQLIDIDKIKIEITHIKTCVDAIKKLQTENILADFLDKINTTAEAFKKVDPRVLTEIAETTKSLMESFRDFTEPINATLTNVAKSLGDLEKNINALNSLNLAETLSKLERTLASAGDIDFSAVKNQITIATNALEQISSVLTTIRPGMNALNSTLEKMPNGVENISKFISAASKIADVAESMNTDGINETLEKCREQLQQLTSVIGEKDVPGAITKLESTINSMTVLLTKLQTEAQKPSLTSTLKFLFGKGK